MATKSKAVNKKAKTVKTVKAAKSLTEAELEKLAMAGTKEAIAKIEKFIASEKDEEKKAFGEMMLEECEFYYYDPRNEKEEEEFYLLSLINKREQRISDLIDEAGAAQLKVDKMMLEKKVHDKVLAKNKDKKDLWQYNFIGDMVGMDQSVVDQIEDNIAYEEAWVAEARKMITTPRYKTMPAHHIESFDFPTSEDEMFDDKFEDDEEYDDVDDYNEDFNSLDNHEDCDCEGDCGEACDCEDGCC